MSIIESEKSLLTAQDILKTERESQIETKNIYNNRNNSLDDTDNNFIYSNGFDQRSRGASLGELASGDKCLNLYQNSMNQSNTNLDMPNCDDVSKYEDVSKDLPKDASSKQSDLDASGEKKSDAGERKSDAGSISSANNVAQKKKKKGPWYNALAPNYKSRSEDFKKIFKDVPVDERLLVDYSCALQKDILVHGRLYISQNFICFYANIFRWETNLTIRCDNIKAITKEKTAIVIPNAVQINVGEGENAEKYFFTSFTSRDKAFLMLFKVWQNALAEKPMDSQELWQMVHHSYGDELGLTSSDDDYVAPSEDIDESNFSVHYKVKNGDSSDNINISKQSISAPVSPNASNADIVNANNTVSEILVLPIDTKVVNNDDVFTETQCENHEHRGKLFLDEVFSIDVDHMFELLFTDSEFYEEFIRARKTSDLKTDLWPEKYDLDGTKVRTLTYTLSLNYPIGPKSTLSIEKQIIQPETKVSQRYIIDTEVSNPQVPYGDSFYVFSRYCILKVSDKRTRLKVHSEVCYSKNSWAFVKNIIGNKAESGIKENYHLLAVHLRKESDRLHELNNPSSTPLSIKKRNNRSRRRRLSADKVPRIHSESPETKASGYFDIENFYGLGNKTLHKILVFLLIILVGMNLYLYLKISSLEMRIHINNRRNENSFEIPNSAGYERDLNWNEILEKQRNYHRNEIENWKDILSSSMKVINQIKIALENVHRSVDMKLNSQEKSRFN